MHSCNAERLFRGFFRKRAVSDSVYLAVMHGRRACGAARMQAPDPGDRETHMIDMHDERADSEAIEKFRSNMTEAALRELNRTPESRLAQRPASGAP